MKTKDQIQQEALDAIGDSQKAGVSVSMGVGKSFLGLKHQAKFYHDAATFLVVAPKLKIFDSWKDDAEKFGYQGMLDHITFSTYRSLPKQSLDYDVVYLDECHSLKYTHGEWLKAFEATGGKIVGLTGTYPPHKGNEKGKMCRYFCPLVYEYHTDDAVDDEILNDYQIFVHKLSLDGNATIEVNAKNGNSWMTSEVKSYRYWTERLDAALTDREIQIARIQRMKALQSFPSKEVYAKKLLDKQTDKTILFANTKAQADKLCMHSVHSSNKQSDENLEAFKAGEITKLSAVEQLSEGANIPNLKVGIIMHAYANNRKTAQKLGRMLRLNPDDTAIIHILCYENSVDKEWVTSALSHLDQSKISWVFPSDLHIYH